MSIQGESTYQGRACVFVRLAGCNLDCTYCDTRYAAKAEGTKTPILAIIEKVKKLGVPLVEITGGEPLVQENCGALISKLLDSGLKVLVETNGTVDLEKFDRRAVYIVDVKLPGSGAFGAFNEKNYKALKPTDEIKFVVSHRADFDTATAIIEKNSLAGRLTILFSPVTGRVEPDELAAWLLDSGLPARLNLQLHKFIWGAGVPGV